MEELERELEYLYSLERFGMIFGLENVSALLHHLGDPHLELKAIHVTGTNGKGSVCAFLHSVLSRRYKVGLYTSPHLHRVNERIKINGKEIENTKLLELIKLLRTKVEEKGNPKVFTFFDFLTAIAFACFRQESVDLAIVEVGLGGRLDSTNVLVPLISVITNVGHDHMDVLGPTLEDVAREKAGIIKEGRPLICGELKENPLRVILGEAQKKGSKVLLLGRDFHYEADRRLSFQGRRWCLEGLELGLLGRHQFINATLALAVLELLDETGFPVSEEDVRLGLKETKWPGRLEVFGQGPKVVLDGAHNPEGVEVLCNALEEMTFSRLHLVIGIMADKPWKEMLEKLLLLSDRVIAFRPSNPRALDPQRIVDEARRYGVNAICAKEAKEALQMALDHAGQDDLVLVTGSLFAVAEVRELLVFQG